MIRLSTTIAAFALVTTATPAVAQGTTAGHATHAVTADTADTAMRTPCPLHLTTLALTPPQDTALRAIRAAHMAEVRAVRARLGIADAHESRAVPAASQGAKPTLVPDALREAMPEAMREAMRASMTRATQGVRATLTDSQRTTFDAAVAAHAAEKAERERAGTPHACDDCCREHGHATKREG